jgi:hypothetical protein
MKIIFSKPPKKKILVFDRASSDALKLFISNHQFEILDRRKESVNIYVAVTTFLKSGLKDFKSNYFKNYLLAVNPRIVITFIDNNFTFFLLKKLFPGPKYICIQNGNRNEIFFKELKKFYNLNKNLEIDYFFVFNKNIIKHLSSFVKSKYYSIGSIKNNHFVKKKKINEKKYILFVTQTTSNFRIAETYVFQELNKFCSQKKIKLIFLEKKKSNIFNENFFRDKLKSSNWVYVKYIDIKSTYEIINKSLMVIFLDSTLGYEALSKGIKVACFPYGSLNKSFGNHDIQQTQAPIKFGYPNKFNNSGPFWSNHANKDLIIPLLEKVYNYKSYEWNKIYKKYSSKIMEYDSNNKILKKILKKYL